MVKDVIRNIGTFLNSSADDYPFSGDLESFLYNNYAEMMKQDREGTKELIRELPEICAIAEPGTNIPEFRKVLSTEYARLKKVLGI